MKNKLLITQSDIFPNKSTEQMLKAIKICRAQKCASVFDRSNMTLYRSCNTEQGAVGKHQYFHFDKEK